MFGYYFSCPTKNKKKEKLCLQCNNNRAFNQNSVPSTQQTHSGQLIHLHFDQLH